MSVSAAGASRHSVMEEKIPALQAHVNRPAAPVVRVWTWRCEHGEDHGGQGHPGHVGANGVANGVSCVCRLPVFTALLRSRSDE